MILRKDSSIKDSQRHRKPIVYNNGPDMLPKHVPGVASMERLNSDPELLAEVVKSFPEPPGFPKYVN
jgi:hypothetical protein